MQNHPLNIQKLALNETEFTLIGVEDIRRDSGVELIDAIEAERPDAVCVELDAARVNILADIPAWEALDFKTIIRRKQMGYLLTNLLLVTYQKRFGKPADHIPGRELFAAVSAANKLALPVMLCDRDLRVALNRGWRSISFMERMTLLRSNFVQFFRPDKLTEEALSALPATDLLTALADDLGRSIPTLKSILVDERDAYLAQTIKQTEGRKVVAVVGVGHLKSLTSAMSNNAPQDLSALETIPPKSRTASLLGWLIPLFVIGAIIYIGFTRGGDAAVDSLLLWILSNSLPAGIGAILARAHPITIITAFIVAPVTSLFPFIGGGTVAALVQVWVEPPTVREIQLVGDDILHIKRWWKNSVLRILLVLIFSGLAGLIGTYIGIWSIAASFL